MGIVLLYTTTFTDNLKDSLNDQRLTSEYQEIYTINGLEKYYSLIYLEEELITLLTTFIQSSYLFFSFTMFLLLATLEWI